MAEPTGMLAYIVAGREIRCSTAHAKCLLLYYCANVGKDGTFFKSLLDISFETRLSDSFIRRTNDEWRKKKLISWVEGDWHKGLANTYTLNLPLMQKMAEHSKKQRDDVQEIAREKTAERVRRFRERQKAVTPPQSVTQ
jgi:hypothetical protein